MTSFIPGSSVVIIDSIEDFVFSTTLDNILLLEIQPNNPLWGDWGSGVSTSISGITLIAELASCGET